MTGQAADDGEQRLIKVLAKPCTNLDAGHPCPLELAIEAFDAFGLLLRLDADANATCTLGIPMFQFAILARKELVIQLLLTSGGERHRTPPTGSP